MIDLGKEIWQTISNNRTRTALTGIAVAWGIFMLMVLVGLANGVINSAKSWNQGRDTNVIQIWGGYAGKPYRGLKEGRQIQLRKSNLDAVERELPDNVRRANSEISLSGTISTLGYAGSIRAVGAYPDAITQSPFKIREGRFINEADMTHSRKVIVLDRNTVEKLFDDTTAIVGRKVNFQNLVFTVVGWYDHRWWTDNYIPFSTALALKGYDDRIEMMRVSIKNVATEADGEAVEADLRRVLGEANQHAADDMGALWIWNRFTSEIRNQNAMAILDMIMWIIGILTLLTGLVGVSNIMFVSVRERTHEIGIRRAIGAKPRSILAQIIVESVAITTLAGYVGILLGTAGVEFMRHMFRDSEMIKNPSVSLTVVLYVTLLLIVAGAVAGLFPAIKATKVKPVEALRDE